MGSTPVDADFLEENALFKISSFSDQIHMNVLQIILRLLREINAYRAGHVCLSVCPLYSTREPVDGF
jgi:hypothetical protein